MQAVKKYAIDHMAIMCQDVGLRLDVVQSECLALHNLAVYEFFGRSPAAGARARAVALLDIGARATNLVISAPGCVWFRSIAVAARRSPRR
jgi:Tfp pilus assembly PilM family ATPase